MEMIDEFVDVDVDLHQVYSQWTRFEDFPKFMEGIEKVRRLDNNRLHGVANLAGRRVEWDAEICEQIPDLIIAWRSISGRVNEGHVRFKRLGVNQSRVQVQFIYETADALKKMASSTGTLSARVQASLKRFKQFIENRPEETSTWREENHGSRVRREKLRRIGTRSERLWKGNRSNRLKPPLM